MPTLFRRPSMPLSSRNEMRPREGEVEHRGRQGARDERPSMRNAPDAAVGLSSAAGIGYRVRRADPGHRGRRGHPQRARAGLRAEGFDVDACADGPSGLWKGLEGGHAAIVLDLLLGGISGYRVCEQLRAEGVTTPILVLTAKSGEYDQIDLLDAGADDFLTKPASIALITARLHALIRRTATLSTNVVERGSLRSTSHNGVCCLCGVLGSITYCCSFIATLVGH